MFSTKYLVAGETGKGYGLYRMLAESRGVNMRQVARMIRKMDYSEFLATRYWKLVVQQVQHDAGWRCKKCGRRDHLVVHHPDYRMHGYEMYHADELQCLCSYCHDRIHGIRN